LNIEQSQEKVLDINFLMTAVEHFSSCSEQDGRGRLIKWKEDAAWNTNPFRPRPFASGLHFLQYSFADFAFREQLFAFMEETVKEISRFYRLAIKSRVPECKKMHSMSSFGIEMKIRPIHN